MQDCYDQLVRYFEKVEQYDNRLQVLHDNNEGIYCLNDIRKDLPFDIIAINTDSGSEFLNMSVFNQLKENRIIFTRSRPYKNFWNPYQNFFLPTFKLKKKIRMGARIKKVYDQPKTPYQRLMDSPHLSEEQKSSLAKRREELNPFELKKGLDKHLKQFFKALNEYQKQQQMKGDS